MDITTLKTEFAAKNEVRAKAYNALVARQKQAEEMNKPAKMNGLHIIDDGHHGRCVNECGPIGFYKGVA